MSFKSTTQAWSHSGLKPLQRLVLLCLANHANEAEECWPSLDTLAKETGISRRYVVELVHKLASLGLVSMSKRKRSATTLYRLFDAASVAARTTSERASPHYQMAFPSRPNDHHRSRPYNVHRKAVLARDQRRCRYCGCAANVLGLDHIVPPRLGGGHEPANLVTCCVSCNSRKGTRPPEWAGMRLLPIPNQGAT